MERWGETYNSIAMVYLCNGTTAILPDISLGGQHPHHFNHLGPHIPEAPFDLAMPPL